MQGWAKWACAGMVFIVNLPASSHAECRRVVQSADGSVQIIIPAKESRQAGETETEWCRRIFDRTISASPAMQGRPTYDIDSADIPAHTDKRYAWRYQGGKVKVDPTVPPPPKSAAERRKDICQQVSSDPTTHPLLKDLCATF